MLVLAMVTPKRDNVLVELRALESGVQKNMMRETVTIASVDYTGPKLVERLGQCIDAAARVQAARAALAQALATEETVLEGAHDFLYGLRRTILHAYSNAPTKLNDFGLEPMRVRRPPTNEEAVLRAAKAKATRTKRGTLGKKQKAAIKGNVTGVVITPTTRKDGKD
jgi:hypothetical protein